MTRYAFRDHPDRRLERQINHDYDELFTPLVVAGLVVFLMWCWSVMGALSCA